MRSPAPGRPTTARHARAHRARWAFEKGEPAGAGTGTLPSSGWSFLPLQAPDGTVGALGLEHPADRGPLDVETRTLLAALAEQTAAALHRALLSTEVRRARTAAETERVRNILLASISHDFRTPLASILGSATALIEYEERLERDARQDLLADPRRGEPARHDGAKPPVDDTLEAGALEVRRDWIDVTEALERQIDLGRRRGATQDFHLVETAERILAFVDGNLLDQALANIVGNAVRHAGAEAEVTLRARRDGETVAIRIADDGPGRAGGSRALRLREVHAGPRADRGRRAATAPGSALPSPRGSWKPRAGRSRFCPRSRGRRAPCSRSGCRAGEGA